MDFVAIRARVERSIVGEIAAELVQVEVIDRSLALASKLFVAVIPLSIILKSLTPGQGNFGDELVDRFGLTGAGAQATHNLFATGGEVRGAVSVIGTVIVLYSVLSFTRALQRVYLQIWRLKPQLPDALLRQLRWIAGFILYTVLLSPLRDFERHHNIGSLYAPSAIAVGALFWLWTPHVLLGKRVSWRRLLPSALITTAGNTLYQVGTALFLPGILTANAERYGLIGVAFGLVTWLFAYAAVIVTSAVLGGVWDRHAHPGGEPASGASRQPEGVEAAAAGEPGGP